MKVISTIKQFYAPIQPAIKSSKGDVVYNEFLPDERLQPFVHCYWQLKVRNPLSESFFYNVVADGCMDIFFDLNNPEDNFVMGFCPAHSTFKLGKSFNYVGIRFLPTIFPQVFHVNASELSNRSENLNDVVPNMSHFIARHFNEQQTPEQIKEIFDNHLLKIILERPFYADNRLYEAINIILKRFGIVNIETDLSTGISPRQLRRLFYSHIGGNIKTFSKVVRFQNILKAKPMLGSMKGNNFFLDFGYYDQAHFIKDFKKFYGMTPYRVFR